MSKFLHAFVLAIGFTFIWAATGAHADPISVITTFATWMGKAGLAQLAVKTAISIGLSALSMKLQNRPKNMGGIATESTTTGATNPQSFVMGTYTTAGNLAAPFYTHEYSGDDDNEYLTQIIDLSDVPITSLNKIYIDGSTYTLGPQLQPSDPGYTDDFWYGRQLVTTNEDNIGGLGWVRFWDGTQTTADPKLVATYGTHSERPWTAQHIGTGTAYCVLTFKYRAKHFASIPEPKFEVNGIKLFDPRKAPALGGVGTHVWDDPRTWSPTTNPIVMIYNLLLGVRLADGSVYGVGADFRELPLNKWVAAMNVADETVNGKPRYSNCGWEVIVDDEPLSVIEQLALDSGAKVAESGGIWTVACGAPAAPVAHITDGMIDAFGERTFDPFPGIGAAVNKINATFPDRNRTWSQTEADPYTNADWLAEDGGRETSIDLQLSSIWEAEQVTRVMREMGKDARRFRQHVITLPPGYLILDVLDNITWTSVENGYINKVFEITGKSVDPATLSVTLNIRERDAKDYDFDFDDDTGRKPVYPSPNPVFPVVNGVAGFDAYSVAIGDGQADRRAGIRIVFSPNINARGVAWEIQTVADSKRQYSGTFSDVSLGGFEVETLSNTAYRVRVRAIRGKVETLWSNWKAVTTGDYRLSWEDMDRVILDDFQDMKDDIAAVDGIIDTDIAAAEERMQIYVGSTVGTRIDQYNATVIDPMKSSFSGSIKQLSAGIVSDEMLLNGRFQTGDLSYWTTLTGNVVLHDKTTTSNALLKKAPNQKLVGVTFGSTWQQLSRQPFVPNLARHRIAVSLQVATEAGSVINRTVTCRVGFFDANDVWIASSLNQTKVIENNGEWQVMDFEFPIAAATARKAQVVIRNEGQTNVFYVGDVKMWLFDNSVSARVGTLEYAFADANGSFAVYKNQANTRFKDIEDDVDAQGRAMLDLTSKSYVDGQISAIKLTTEAQYNRNSANGKLRIYSTANTAVGATRIALTAEASNTAFSTTAGMFLQAKSDGTSDVMFDARRFVLVDTGAGNAISTIPFKVVGGVTYINMAMIRDAEIGALKIAKQAFFVSIPMKRADTLLASTRTKAAPLLLFQKQFGQADGGGYDVIFTGVTDTGAEVDAYTGFVLKIDGVEQSRIHIGARTSKADTRGSWSVVLTGNAVGKPNSLVQVYAYTAAWDNYANAGKPVTLRNLRLNISASRR